MIFLSLVHKFSLKLTGFYTLKTGNLFTQRGSQNLAPYKGNKKSCLKGASIIL